MFGQSHDIGFPVHNSTGARLVLFEGMSLVCHQRGCRTSRRIVVFESGRTLWRHEPTRGLHALSIMTTETEMEAKPALRSLEKKGCLSPSVPPYINKITVPCRRKCTKGEGRESTRDGEFARGTARVSCFDTHSGPLIFRLTALGGNSWLSCYLC